MFKSWISGRKVTVVTDHKLLDSCYKENLCTMARFQARCGRWHELLSPYDIVVVYKPGKDNDVADRMIWWAYPAGLADDANFHGLDGDLKGYEDPEAQEKAVNDALINQLSISREVIESEPPCGHTAKGNGHCSEYSDVRAASHYPCFHYECASLGTATPDKLESQRSA